MSLYFIEAVGTGAVKIGVAYRVEKRLKQLQSANPLPLRVLATADCSNQAERELHERFAHLRLRGEWFRLTKRLAGLIRFVAETGRVPAVFDPPTFHRPSYCEHPEYEIGPVMPNDSRLVQCRDCRATVYRHKTEVLSYLLRTKYGRAVEQEAA